MKDKFRAASFDSEEDPFGRVRIQEPGREEKEEEYDPKKDPANYTNLDKGTPVNPYRSEREINNERSEELRKQGGGVPPPSAWMPPPAPPPKTYKQ